MKIKVINKSAHPLPKYQTPCAAGMDLCANLEVSQTLQPMQRKLIPTGLYLELPKGYEAQVRPRSGLALKNGITVLNSPGTVDSDYRGEVGVILINLSNQEFTINDGDRIAQMVISKHESCQWEIVQELEDSERGAGGFGSTKIS
ncbi:dUTP diphosphatase [Planobacterium oryzisoli]|uniref:Deoxyuridine 5'-triphosphate nucleotidohydrolase n=1 Tax=Planobacterium oryzisoli TaxID=2771435 RepID=A0A930YVJ4_9FLAO|nr:dUTP diphosphatase [Planobacterium oryzisoli]MBF5027177.1 dUTP diphosphatase [Planobacterium oryzisoli]